MPSETNPTDLLRACGIVESGLDDSFDRLARLAVGVTHARSCVITFAYDSRMLIKGYWGPKDSPVNEMLPPPELHEFLLGDTGPPVLVHGDVAGAVIRFESGIKVGCVCVRSITLHRSTRDALDALADIAQLAGTELAVRQARQPDERTAKILESMTDAWVFLDRDWRYTYVNKKAGQLFNRDPSALVGKHIWTEFPDGVGQSFHLAYEAALAEQVPRQIEGLYPPWNRWFENRIYPGPDGLAIFFQDVTERRRADDERRRLANIVETTTDMVAIADAEGGLLFLNRAARALLGIAIDGNVLDVHLLQLHAMASRESICDAIAAAMQIGSWHGDAMLVHASGAKIPVTEVLVWHPGLPPDRGYFSLVARDITEKRCAEMQREKDQQVRAQTERMAHLGYWTWDLASNRASWSDELYRMFGLEPGSVVISYEEYLARVHPQDRAKVRDAIQTALRDRTGYAFYDRIVRADGQIRHMHTWASASLDDEGRLTHMFGICLDSTELLLTTKHLQQTAEWLGAALRNTHIAVWEWDLHTSELKFSEGAVEVLGVRPEALAHTAEAYLGHVHPDDVDALVQAFRACMDHGTEIDLEHRIVLADRCPRWFVVRCRPALGPDGRIDRLLGTILDVTDRHQAEEDRRTLLQRLKDAQKMEAIGRLAAGVAHDFNNHLTVIQTAVELLSSTGVLAEPYRQLAADIDEAAENAAKLTRQLLTFGRQQQQGLEMRALDLNELIRNTSKLLRHLLPSDIEIELALAPELPPVHSDREQLERVLLNLIVNARDAMPDGGRLTIGTRSEDGQAVFEVRDSGVGMAPDIQERIFEPFFTTKAEKNGTGLGLATVYGIVTQNGGSIEVKSELGTGTTFSIRLPFA
jgi:PAS domain S-box-containing protein